MLDATPDMDPHKRREVTTTLYNLQFSRVAQYGKLYDINP